MVIGGGTNLIVSDAGFRGIMLRFVARRMLAAGDRVQCDAGAVLQDLVDFSIERGLQGLETLAGIPGSVGAAVYGNAGAYGHSISERVRAGALLRWRARARLRSTRRANSTIARAFSSATKTGSSSRPNCAWSPPTPATLRKTAADILKVRNEKFPVTMKCAGSIFKNLLLAELPPAVAARCPRRWCAKAKCRPRTFWNRWAPRACRAAIFTWPRITPT